jgi:Holliday junction resolvase
MAKLLEKDIQKQIVDYLTIKGWYLIRVNSGAQFVESKGKKRMIRLAPAGTPDIIACSPEGRFYGIEVKRPGNKPTQLQKETLQRITATGGVGMWVTSVDELIEDITSS